MTPEGCDCEVVARAVEGVENENCGVFEFDVVELGAPRDGKPSVLEG